MGWVFPNVHMFIPPFCFKLVLACEDPKDRCSVVLFRFGVCVFFYLCVCVYMCMCVGLFCVFVCLCVCVWLARG